MIRTVFLVLAAFALIGTAAADTTISGKLTHNGSPIRGFVNIYRADQTGSALKQTTADTTTGDFTLINIPDGQYYVQTLFGQSSGVSYIDEVYNNVQCVAGICPLASGTLITVAGSPITGINFDLADGGSISGTITNSNNAPLEGVGVVLLDASFHSVTNRLSASNGSYSFGGLPSGVYFIKTFNSKGFVDEAYNDVSCPAGSCDFTNASPVIVTAPSDTTNISFALGTGSTISGIVRDTTGIAIEDASIAVFNSSGIQLTSVKSAADGTYTSGTGLLEGAYYATVTKSGYFSQLYSALNCTDSCVVVDGDIITVPHNTNVSNINFAIFASPAAGQASADLSGSFRTLSKSGKNLSVTMRVKNSGTADSTPFSIAVYQSKSKRFGADAKLSKRIRRSSLAKGKKIDFSFTAPQKTGSKYVIAVVDDKNAVVEGNESNNSRSKKIP